MPCKQKATMFWQRCLHETLSDVCCFATIILVPPCQIRWVPLITPLTLCCLQIAWYNLIDVLLLSTLTSRIFRVVMTLKQMIVHTSDVPFFWFANVYMSWHTTMSSMLEGQRTNASGGDGHTWCLREWSVNMLYLWNNCYTVRNTCLNSFFCWTYLTEVMPGIIYHT